ncbi:MAG TPA: hypothetical protein VMT46_04740 [Anaerolineaceae bacterium]|nr:hypothetical protein [Anaerolineaceae bacterium]
MATIGLTQLNSTMFPSDSDRISWLALVGGLLMAAALLAGAGPWLAENLEPGLLRAVQAATAVLGISLGMHAVLILPAWRLQMLLS